MEFNQILELIDHVSASELTAFTYETADLTLSMEHGKPQIIQGVMGETVENIPAAGMAGGKVRRAVHTVPMAGAGSVGATVSDPADEVAAADKNAAETQGVQNTVPVQNIEQPENVSQKSDDQTGSLVTSPLVGTFYRAASPEAESFVKVGDTVAEDSVIGIIEAMKVMNEIKAEKSGVIKEILVENGQPVEYGQPLLVIE